MTARTQSPRRSTPRERPREEGTRGWKITLAIIVGGSILRLLAATWRYRFMDTQYWEALRRDGRPFIFALWHGQLLPLLWVHRGQAISVVISSHRDGEIIAGIVERLGFKTIRGSSSRGGARALLGLVAELEKGTVVAVTPDGPRGPAEQFAPGALVASQRSGAPIVAIAASAPRSWRMRSWDRFMIPKPFARITVAYSAPTRVEAASAREAEGEAPRFEALIRDTVAAAEQG